MHTEHADLENPDLDAVAGDEGESIPPPEMPLGIVLARILVVSAMSFSAAVAIFAAVGAIWIIAGISVLVTIFFLVLMFAIERLAEQKPP